MCENKVSYHVASGYSYRETFVRCGSTDPYGYRAICDVCASQPAEMARIRAAEAAIDANNAWAASAGYGEY
jgi:hypothetical protein